MTSPPRVWLSELLSLWLHCCVSSQALGFTGGMQLHPTEEASAVEFVYSVMSLTLDFLARFLLRGYRKLKFVCIMIESSLFDTLKYYSKFSYAGHVLCLNETLLHGVTSSCTSSGFTKPKITASF